jgi:hypothetical protein
VNAYWLFYALAPLTASRLHEPRFGSISSTRKIVGARRVDGNFAVRTRLWGKSTFAASVMIKLPNRHAKAFILCELQKLAPLVSALGTIARPHDIICSGKQAHA